MHKSRNKRYITYILYIFFYSELFAFQNKSVESVFPNEIEILLFVIIFALLLLVFFLIRKNKSIRESVKDIVDEYDFKLKAKSYVLNEKNNKLINQIEEAKRREEEFSKIVSAFEQSANSVIITDLNGKIEYVNNYFTEKTGYKKEEVINTIENNIEQILNDEIKRREFHKDLNEGKNWKGIFKNYTIKGKSFWEKVVISPVKKDNGKISYFIMHKEDITEQRKNENDLLSLNRYLELKSKCSISLLLAETEEQLYNEFCNIAISTELYCLSWIGTLEVDSSIDNLKVLEYAGEKEEFLDEIKRPDCFAELLPLKDAVEMNQTKYINDLSKIDSELCNKYYSKYLFGSAITLPFEISDKEKGFISLYSNKKNIFEEEEIQAIYDLTFLLGYGVRAIRDKVMMQNFKEQLIREREELSTTLSAIDEGVITTDINGSIILTNKSANNILGINNCLGQKIYDILKINDSKIGEKYLEEYFKKHLFDNEKINNKNLSILSSKNDKRIISLNSSCIYESKKVEGIVFAFRDITDRIQIENQLALSQKMESIGHLAAGIAHEMNTPLQYVNDNTEFLCDAFKSIADYEKQMENGNEKNKQLKEEYDIEFLREEIPSAILQSKEGLKRVSKIVLAMKDFAHPGKDDKSLNDINRAIEVTSTISKNEWKYHADLELEFDEKLPMISCQLEEINQVILNVIVNSAHAIEEKNNDEKGKIKISTKKLDDEIEIRFEDTGIGIKEEHINKIFDPFFTTKEVGRGTGQGLAIVHDIISNKHNGKIDIKSEYGKGTTFIIKLPISDENEL